MNWRCFTSDCAPASQGGNTVEYALDQSYKIESLRQFYSMIIHVEIIISDALNSLLNGNVRVSAKIDILRFSETY